MPSLIAIETATDVCSVAFVEDGRISALLALHRPRAHAESLVPMIRDALRYAGASAADLDAVAVSQGPGSYTGLRIGVSTAKGLASAVDARLVPVPSLEALASAAAPFGMPGDVVCAAFRARRREVFAAAFLVGGDGTLAPAAETAAIAPDQFEAWLPPVADRRLWLAGDGAARLEEALGRSGWGSISVLDAGVVRPSGAHVGRLAHDRLQRGMTADVAEFEPFYLKEFVAKKPQGTAFEKLTF